MTEPDEPVEQKQPEEQSDATAEPQPATTGEKADRFVNVTAATPEQAHTSGLPTSWKIIIVIMLPILTALIIYLIATNRQQTVIVYKTELLSVGDKCLKLLSEGDIGTAYDMLHPSTQDRIAAEVMESDYKKAAAGLGAFVTRGSYDWGPAPKGEAPTSYTARFNYEKGAIDATLQLKAVRIGSSSAPLEYRILNYSFKRVL